MKLLDPGSSEYATAFQALLCSSDERTYIKQLLDELLSTFSQATTAIDWGAGTGALTSDLLQRFCTVYAVEPHPISEKRYLRIVQKRL